MANSSTPVADHLVSGAKLVGDVVVMPGIGQMVEGNVGAGILYGVAGIAARALLGPIGWIAIGLDAYSMSASGRHVWQLLGADAADTTPHQSVIVRPEEPYTPTPIRLIDVGPTEI